MQTPAVWQVTTVDSEDLTVVATANFHAGINEFLQLYLSVPGRYTTICER